METEDMEKEWLGIRSGLGTGYEEKLVPLFESENKESVSQCMELLLSFGESALCAVMEEKEGEWCLRSEIDFVYRFLWEREIVGHVSEEESLWHSCYQREKFDGMEFRVLGDMDGSSLSNSQKELVKRESLRTNEIPVGSFLMGALPNDEEAGDNEKPQHEVTLTKGMLFGRYACTQGLYEKVMGTNPSHFKGLTRPVENVSWCEAVLFCNRLSELEGLEPAYVLPEPFENCRNWSKQVKWKQGANGYRLSTEAEWEYCARAGENYKYSGSDNLDEVGWYTNSSGSKTHTVGQKKANGYGLYDMSGNVWEWVWDSGCREYDSSITDPVYIDVSSPNRVRRGGSWNLWTGGESRVSIRSWYFASGRFDDQGFRFLRTVN